MEWGRIPWKDDGLPLAHDAILSHRAGAENGCRIYHGNMMRMAEECSA
jgi:hypothetical protein